MKLLETFNFVGSYMVLITTLIILCILYKSSSTFKISLYLKYLFIGGVINLILKHIIREPRPMDMNRFGLGYKYGMPSGHTQFIVFNINILLYLLYSIGLKKNILLWAIIVGFFTIIITGYHRVYFGYHTLNQTLIGGIIGLILSLIMIEN